MRETIKQGNGYAVMENGEAVAEITYQPLGEESLVIDHTFVSESLRGQKVGEELVRAVVDQARKETKRSFRPVRTRTPFSSGTRNITIFGGVKKNRL